VRKTNASWETPALKIGLAAGTGMGILAAVIELFVLRALHIDIENTPTVRSAALEAFAVAAVPEEVVKYVALLIVVGLYLEGRRLQDVLLLAVGIGMGFAGLENIIYVAGSQAWELTAIIRAVSAVPTHGILALIMGALVIATVLSEENRWLGLLLALVVPILLHGAYDTLQMVTDPDARAWTFPATVGVMFVSGVVAIGLCSIVLPKAAELDAPLDQKRRPVGPARPKQLSRFARGFLFALVATAWISDFDATISWACAYLGVLPLLLSFDLILTRQPNSLDPDPLSDVASHA